ncbi:transglycosylase domain-containing protein [Haloglycomyces albus]|uniref:transglycosylase domain-containing protein n=1 Tax=Haloglycomyces albus TaxID=526067 RepID=UPI00046CA893|nr:transglycosylase domain-containing protein [Haloglycomyces albus]
MQKLRVLRPIGSLFKLVSGSILAGILVAALVLPIVAGPGYVADKALDFYDTLPTELTEAHAPQTTNVFASDGETLITRFFQENRRQIPLEENGQNVVDAVLSAEDSNFRDHGGVDFPGLIRATAATISGDNPHGASTITMQYVRNTLRYNSTSVADIIEATQRTPDRKLREIKYALDLEKELSKDDILEGYLNVVYLGNHSYGVHAASYTYFNTAPAELELHQAAFIAALPKYPSYADGLLIGDTTNEDRILDRRNWVLDRMADDERITSQKATQAKSEGLDLDPRPARNECNAAEPNNWGFFCDYFTDWWAEQEAFGESRVERLNLLKRGGFNVVTSLDPEAQQKAMDSVHDKADNDDQRAHGSVALTPGTGHVTVMAINRVYSLDQSNNGPRYDERTDIPSNYPNTTLPLLSGNDASYGYPAGSTFKMFTLLAGLEEGYPLRTTIPSPREYPSIYAAGEGATAVCGDQWCPENDSDWMSGGTYNLWKAFGRSSNTVFVQLQEMVGVSKAVEMAERLGVEFREPDSALQKGKEAGTLDTSLGTFTLGFDPIPPIDMAESFATVAAGGQHCEPLPVKAIYDSDGTEWEEPTQPDCEQVIDKEIADAAVSAGHCTVAYDGDKTRCSGATAKQASGFGEPIFGKTGTADEERAYWFVGSTPSATTATFVGDPDSYTHTNVARGWGDKVIDTGLDILKTTSSKEGDWEPPTKEMIKGDDLVKVPKIKCEDPSDAVSKISAAGFQARVSPTQSPSSCPKGQAYSTSVTGSAPSGAPIYILISDGSDYDDDDDDEDDEDDDRGPPELPGPPRNDE